jgi:hypothetical protein
MANLLYDLLGKIPVVQQIRQERGELAALRQMYDKSNAAGGLVPGRYYGLYDQGTGNLKGVSAACHCGSEYRMLSMFECFRQGYKCPNCKMEINVLKFLSAVDAEGTFKVKAHDIEALISRLPVRPVGVASDVGPRTLDTWGSNDEVRWDGTDDKSRSRAFERGDPGAVGPGF